MNERENKLPAWARSELQNLRRTVKELEGLVQAYGQPWSNRAPLQIGHPPGLGVFDGLALPDRVVAFALYDGEAWSDRIRVSITHERDRSYLSVNGGDVLRVEPAASNSVKVWQETHPMKREVARKVQGA